MPKMAGDRNKMVRMTEVKESCVKYGTETLITTDLLYLAVQPVDREKIENLLTENSIVKIGAMSIAQLKKLGFTENQAVKISAVFEIARRWSVHTDDRKLNFSQPQAVYDYMFPRVRGFQKERFSVLILDTKNNIIKEELISIGSLNASIVHPREVFKAAIENSAASIILVHNHPSGDPAPSREDLYLTQKLTEGGKLLGIDVLDHVIIGEGKYKSLITEGLM